MATAWSQASRRLDMSGTAPADSAETIRTIARKWWLLAVFGVVTLAFGVVLTFKPGKSVHAIAVILGIWLLILGVVRLIEAIGATGERLAYLVAGLIAILFALLLLHHTTTTVAVLGFTIGIFWTIGGAAEFIHGFSANDGRVSWPVVILGAISAIIGVLCLVYPSLSLSILCVIVGIGMIIYGIVEILAGLQIRKLKEI
jgi:uncharacterized membrane protein HdeD (DUF308 family)